MDFQYFSKANIVFGYGELNKLSQILDENIKRGGRLLIVTGRNSTKKSGLLDRIEKVIKAHSLNYKLFDKITSNPLDNIVSEGGSLAREFKPDLILAVGGGSTLDASKAISVLGLSESPIIDYVMGKKIVDAAIPIVAIPTTCGTGSEVNGISVITISKTGDKKSFNSPYCVPRASIVDPQLMMTMPKRVFRSVTFDAFCHLSEAYLSKKSNIMTDVLALGGLRYQGDNLLWLNENYDEKLTDEKKNAWSKVVYSSTLGGLTLNAIGAIACHSLEHPQSGLKNVAHGEGLAAVTPMIFHKLYEMGDEITKSKLDDISLIIGGKKENSIATNLLNFMRNLGVDFTLEDIGIEKNDIPWMVENCFKIGATSLQNTPINMTKELVEEIYIGALTFNKEFR